MFYVRRFLDEAPARSLAGVMAVVEPGYGSITLTDGQNAATIDFFFHTEEERTRAEEKLARIQEVVDEFSSRIRLSSISTP